MENVKLAINRKKSMIMERGTLIKYLSIVFILDIFVLIFLVKSRTKVKSNKVYIEVVKGS